ncbi:hypothetical protein DVQ85_16990 [Yersinia enterocolitica]|nr:hypothetical protein [Yersinia enterocolitica]EKN5990611.1 hypothetical protein [Yersinia enterocolitica]
MAVSSYLPFPLRSWNRSGVSCIRSPESLTDVSSSGFSYLLPCCNPNDFGEYPASLEPQPDLYQ